MILSSGFLFFASPNILTTPSNHQIHVKKLNVFESNSSNKLSCYHLFLSMEIIFYKSASCVIPERGLSMFTAQLCAVFLLSLAALQSHHLYHKNTIAQPHVFLFLSIITRASALFTVSSGVCVF